MRHLTQRNHTSSACRQKEECWLSQVACRITSSLHSEAADLPWWQLTEQVMIAAAGPCVLCCICSPTCRQMCDSPPGRPRIKGLEEGALRLKAVEAPCNDRPQCEQCREQNLTQVQLCRCPCSELLEGGCRCRCSRTPAETDVL